MFRHRCIWLGILLCAVALIASTTPWTSPGMAGAAPAPAEVLAQTSSNLALMSRVDIDAWDVAVSGQYTYAVVDKQLFGCNTSNPLDPEHCVATAPFATYNLSTIAVEGEYAYVADGPNLYVVDIGTPPFQPVGNLPLAGTRIFDVDVAGSYAYIANGQGGLSGGLQILDISNPASPQLVGSYGLETTYGVTVRGDYAYIAMGGAGTGNSPVTFRIINIANPSNPYLVAEHDVLARAREIAVAGDFAFIAEDQLCPQGDCIPGGGGLRIVNIASPSNPYQVAYYDYGDAESVAVWGDYAFISTPAGLRILNISNPGAAYEVAYHEELRGALATQSDYAVVARGALQFVCFTERMADGADLGFRLCPDGYAFTNYADTSDADFTIEDMRKMFGTGVVCANIPTTNHPCIPWPNMRKWNDKVNNALAAGHCLGMAATSARFFLGIGPSPSDFLPLAHVPLELKKDSVRRHIAYFAVQQFALPIRLASQDLVTPNGVLQEVKSTLAGGEMVVLVMNGSARIAHAVTPYAVEDLGDGVWAILVYDNQLPMTSTSVLIDTVQNSWVYPPRNWSGPGVDPLRATLYTIPLSQFESPLFPFPLAGQGTEEDEGQVWLDGGGHLLIEDSLGRRLGFAGTQFVREIPDAYEQVVIGGLEPSEPIYTLPLTDTHTIHVDGQTLTKTVPAEITQFGAGYAASLSGIMLAPGIEDQVRISNDGSQLAYDATGAQVTSFSFATNTAAIGRSFVIEDLEVAAGTLVTATVHMAGGQFVVDGAHGSEGDYGFRFERVTQSGIALFWHMSVNLTAGSTHYLDFAAWDGVGPLQLHIDYDSDGTIDESVPLDNERATVFLPALDS